MEQSEFERRMRELEWFHDLRALAGTWPILRVDGRSFSALTEACFEKPFDEAFHRCMTASASALLTELGAVYAYTESDEISVLLPRASQLFDRELEKLVSVSAGIASSVFTHEHGTPAHFDSRLLLCAEDGLVVDYFRWRQSDATRCGLNGWCYWTLRKEGQTAAEATKALEGATTEMKHDLLFGRGINFNDLPTWQKRGVGLRWETYDKEGVNPITNEATVASRRRVRMEGELPYGDAYGAYLRRLLRGD